MKRIAGAAAVLAVAVSAFAAGGGSAFAADGRSTDAGGATITGRIGLGRAEPWVDQLIIAKNRDVCGSGIRDVYVVRANGDALLDAVVYLENVVGGKRFRAAAKKITIDQKRCVFVPRLSVLANGGVLEAINSDPVLHNIHVYEVTGRARQTVMNVSQPEKGNIATKRIRLRSGTAMKLECDAHDFMHAHIFVARNPYYAVVDENGAYEIDAVPPGRYTIAVWHGDLGTRKGTVVVPAQGTVRYDLSY